MEGIIEVGEKIDILKNDMNFVEMVIFKNWNEIVKLKLIKQEQIKWMRKYQNCYEKYRKVLKF